MSRKLLAVAAALVAGLHQPIVHRNIVAVHSTPSARFTWRVKGKPGAAQLKRAARKRKNIRARSPKR